MSIDFYKEFGEYGFLANYSPHGFYQNGIYYPTVEHYYQSEKFDNPNIRDSIITAKTPKEASMIGRDRTHKRKEHFRDQKLQVMYEGVLEKFRQNPDIRSKLIETRNQIIREMTVKESYWGVGPDLDGENHIGQILMNVREQVKKEVLDTILEEAKKEKVYVIGHHHPDPDSVFSSLVFTHILRSFGIDAVFAVRDEEFVEKKMIDDFLKEDYEMIDDYHDKKFILVDHNHLDGIPKENVIGSIDHHIITNEVSNLIEIEYASCGLLLYDLFRNSYDFSDDERKLIGLTVLSDTEYLVSSRFGEEDRQLYQKLNCGIDVGAAQKKYFETTDFSDSISDNFHKDYKEYDYNGYHIKRSMITSYHDGWEEHYTDYILEIEKNDINLLIWCDYESKTTFVIYQGKEYVFPYFTTSTNLVLKYLEKQKVL